MSAQLNHEQATELLPWLVNGTLTGAELDSVERHVRSCVTCRLMLREQRQLEAAVQSQPTVPLSAEQGFERLLRQMDVPDVVPDRRRVAPRFSFTRSRAHAALLAASITAVGVGVWLATPGGQQRSDGAYSTLSRKAPATSTEGVRLDLIFVKSATEADMRALLGDIDATIVGGPSDLGRYTVQLNAATPRDAQVTELLERLARDQRIRFAGRSMMDAAQ